MSERLRRYNAQEALERIWSDSGNEEDFDSDENEDELYELASEDESGEYEYASSSNEDNVGQDYTDSSDDEAPNDGDRTDRVNRIRQRPAREQQANLVW